MSQPPNRGIEEILLSEVFQSLSRQGIIVDFWQQQRIFSDVVSKFLRESSFPTYTPVLQSWLSMITRRQQGVVILGLRGPDGFPKEHPCKNAMRSIRACVMNNGRTGIPMTPGLRYHDDSFMRMDLIYDDILWETQCVKPFFSCIDQYNIHFFQHFVHAAAVVGFNHPDPIVADRWHKFYLLGCSKLHMNPESKEQFQHRLRDGVREEDSPFPDSDLEDNLNGNL